MSLKDDIRDLRMDPPGGYGVYDQEQEPEEDEEDNRYWIQRGYETLSDADG